MSEELKYDVDINIANKAKEEMAESLETTNKRVLNKIGAFSSLYDINFPEYKNPVLVLKTEEPGSKQILAFKYDKIENICYDMINHLINDCIVMGAKPLTVQDAIICGKLDKEKVLRIVKAVSNACKEQGCVLTGGETSEQPGVLDKGIYILTSSIVGIAEKDKMIDGSKIKQDDIVLGVESSGLHTNGYTMVRQLIDKDPDIVNRLIDGKRFIDIVLEPHRCYYKSLEGLFDKDIISGLAHITGGGVKENLNRILPNDLNAEIKLETLQILPIFKAIKKSGNISDEEMLRTFNMSIGLCIVCDNKDKEIIKEHLNKFGINSYEIGRIVEGNKEVILKGNLNWT
ncbi:MAG: phosphoribosylformylglycinamidine cyclo-ligase [Candidatus Delongbacteria bacterium]|nr:phosphoribosylformylglycinamidine cyclo-ligase [Candidatus Delongbacteria bacterium]